MKTPAPVLALFLAALIGVLIVPALVQAKNDNQPGGALGAVEARLAELEALLLGATRGIDPDTGCDTLLLTGMNVQLVNGHDDDKTATTNG